MTTIAPAAPLINISDTPTQMGQLAASQVAEAIRLALKAQSAVRMIFAAAPSQLEMLHALVAEGGIDWSRVEAFHMDEYLGLPQEAEQRFGAWLTREFFAKVPLGVIHLIEPGSDANRSAEAYTALLNARPIDIVCLGIGMNGHIAFNDPPANFNEGMDVRIVELDRLSRVQQVEEGLFPSLDRVPTHALTLSVPRLLRAGKLFCCVPGSLKENAVTRAFTGDVDPSCPASILRDHKDCTVFLDREAAAGLQRAE